MYRIDPLTDNSWNEFVLEHARATVFHSSGWLGALQKTYGYTPVVLSTSRTADRTANALVLCEVKSWLTGQRLVSLPFSDHCDVLAESTNDEEELLAQLQHEVEHDRRWRYAEIRPQAARGNSDATAMLWRPAETYCFHVLNLNPSLEELFRNLHKNSMKQSILRAEREGLKYDQGRSESFLREFYALLLRTRRRHGLPPQPLTWFRNLAACMGESLNISLATKDDCPVAGILTLRFKDTLTYKYSCSDERFNRLGGMPFLLWRTIQEAKNEGMRQFDLGRSDMDNEGLITFKDRLGATKTTMTYWRCSARALADSSRPAWLTSVAEDVFARLPDTALVALGRLLYREIG